MLSSQHKPSKTNEHKKSKVDSHLSNERTLLAWIRTGLTIFTLGAAIARFGGNTTADISLRNPNAEKKPVISGLILAITGVVCLLYGLWRFLRTHRRIENEKDLVGIAILGPIISMIALTSALIAVIIIFFII